MQLLQYSISYILHIIVLINSVWIAIFFLWKTKIRSQLKEKFDGYFFLIALFFLIMAIGLLIRFYYMFIYTMGDINIFYEAFFEPSFRDSHPLYAKLVILYGLLVIYAVGCITFAIEHYVYKRTRHILSIINVIYMSIISPLLLILPYEHSITTTVVNLPIIMTIITVFILIAIYLNIAWKSSGLIRKKAIYVILGFLLFFGGIMLNSQIAMLALGITAVDVVWFIGLLFNIAIILLFYGSYLKKSD